MAITVNDGSVKWQAIKLSEADTLGGLTANDIKSQAISGKVVQSTAVAGNTTMSYKEGNAPTFTIPCPSGYTRSQCVYIVPAARAGDGGDPERFIQVSMSSVNQTNGVITASVGNGGRYGKTVSINCNYLVVAVK